jgi:hypothetical protein
MLVNAASNVGSVDAYVEVAGTDPATVTPLESNIGFGTVGTPTVRDAAGYRVILTTPGNPADVVFESATFTIPAGRSAVLVLTNGIGISDTLLLVLGQAAGIIPAANAQAAVRVINAAADAPTRDIYLDDDFSAPFLPAAAFGSVSDYQIQTPTTHEFIVTPAGNMSVEELRAAPALSADRYQTLWITGNSTEGLAARLSVDDLRPISGAAGLVIANGATSFLGIEFFVTSPDVNIAEVAPTAQLFAGDVNARINLPPGELELTLRDPVSQTIVAGPLPITVAAEGVYGLLAVEAVGGSTVDIVFFDDFN